MYSNTDTEGTIESVRIGTKPPWELLGILGGGVPPSSPTPDPISHLKKSCLHPFSDLSSKKLCHHYSD